MTSSSRSKPPTVAAEISGVALHLVEDALAGHAEQAERGAEITAETVAAEFQARKVAELTERNARWAGSRCTGGAQ